MLLNVMIAAGLSVALLGSFMSARAQTAADVAACKPDAMRLCHPVLADYFNHDRIIGCLRGHRWRLAPACRAALTNNGF